jgi:hypothetical protein
VLEQGLVHQPVVPEGVHQSNLLDLAELVPLRKSDFLEAAHELLISYALAVFQLGEVDCCMEECALISSESLKVLLDVVKQGKGDELGIFQSKFGEGEDKLSDTKIV